MAEEYTCIECENLYNDMDGDTDERLCNKCGCQIYEEDTGVINVDYNGNLIKERRDQNIKRSSTTHYPDWDMKKKIYITRKRKS